MRAPIDGYRWALFFAVRMLNVKVQADRTLTGNPVAVHPGSPATLTANALYILESGANASKPAAGDIIEAELRWGAGDAVHSTRHSLTGISLVFV